MRKSLFVTVLCVGLLFIACAVQAVPMSVTDVTGKEYTDFPDIDASGAASQTQVLLWDGYGNVTNGVKLADSGEVDALANLGDAYYWDVINNNATLLFSVQGWGDVFYEDPDGSIGLWATPAQINAANPPVDVDSLEVWGPDGYSDANRYSLLGDARSGTSVYTLGGGTWITASQIAAAIGAPSYLWQLIDVEGLMTWDINTPGQWSEGDSLLFSIRPVTDPTTGSLVYDGGEIWYWTYGDAAATDFVHGGHTWDTAFSVQDALEDALGQPFNAENVNALEATPTVPEPTSMVALLAGAGGLLGLYRRRRA